MSKNGNMLSILWMLNTGAQITAKQMSEKLEINIRTVYRYIDALCASGVPIISESGHHGGYRLLQDFIRAPLLFSMEEQKALLHAAVFAQGAGYPFDEALNHSVLKLKSYSNQEQLSELNRHLTGFEVISGSNELVAKQILSEIEQAAADEYSVEIEYRSGREEQPKSRTVDPYGVVYWNNKWYTVAFCQLRNEIRSFRADRIISVKRTEFGFKRPAAFSVRSFFLERLLPDLGEGEGPTCVIIEGREASLDDLCHNWFMQHYLIERTTNQARFLLDEEIIHKYVPYFLLPYGKTIKVLEPTSFKNTVQTILQDLIVFYEE